MPCGKADGGTVHIQPAVASTAVVYTVCIGGKFKLAYSLHVVIDCYIGCVPMVPEFKLKVACSPYWLKSSVRRRSSM